MSTKRRPSVFLKSTRASKILALVPREHAPSDASENSDSEPENVYVRPQIDFDSNTSPAHSHHEFDCESSSAPSIASSLENLNLDSSFDGNPVDTQYEPEEEALLDTVPLTPILQEIRESNYENIPSNIPSVSSIPATSITPRLSRKTRSKQPTASAAKRVKRIKKKVQLTYTWKKVQFRHRATIEEEENMDYVDMPEPSAAPLSYFELFFSKDIMSDIVDQTNFYSVQETGKSIQLTEDEFRDFLAIHVIMGIVGMPSYLDYWSEKYRYDKVADIMSLKRYQQIQRYLHFADNNLEDGDRYYKIRPVFEKIRQNCLKQQHNERKFSIDEMMIAYKGSKAGKRKQYMKDKPNKWGFKNYVRAGVSGIIYDFVIYAGDDTFRYHTFSEEELSLGFGAQVVIALCQTINQKPAIIFCDNFFSSPELFYFLRENYGIFGLGTIRNNRLRGAEQKMLTEKEMKKKPRGTYAEVVCNKSRLAVVRWNDNKAVTLISSYAASEPVGKILRYSKEEKKKVEVPCPQVVLQYNHHMGGVDLADMLISLFKTPFKSRRWYLGIFAQLLDICINNAWLMWRKRNAGISRRKMPLKTFRFQIYESLIGEMRCKNRKATASSKIKKPRVALPSSPIKYDNFGHFPSVMEEGRCRYCQKKTVVYCTKCNTRLCFVTGKNARNCFLNFHTK